MPPESCPGNASADSARSRSLRSRRASAVLSAPAGSTSRTLSSTVSHGISREAWNTMPIRIAGSPSEKARRPSMATSPSRSRSRPAAMARSVLFPDPDGPTIATISPGAAASASASRAGRAAPG